MAEAKADTKKNDGIDIEKLSFEDLLKLQAQVKEKFAEKQKAEKEKAIAEIKSKIELLDITAEELGFSSPAKAKKSKAPNAPKTVAYKNDKGETWSGGRGPKPQWVKDVISKHGIAALEQYKVQ